MRTPSSSVPSLALAALLLAPGAGAAGLSLAGGTWFEFLGAADVAAGAGGDLPALPMEVDLLSETDVSVTLVYIRGATITGIIQVYAPDASLLPSQTFAQIRHGGPAKPLPVAARELKPSHGLGAMLVEVRSGDQVFRRVINGNGEFRFAGLKPGTWTVKIDPEALPENATIDQTSMTLEAKPSAEEHLEFRVEQRIRAMRMLPTLKVSG